MDISVNFAKYCYHDSHLRTIKLPCPEEWLFLLVFVIEREGNQCNCNMVITEATLVGVNKNVMFN